MLQRKRGFTTLPDIEEFKKIRWTFLINIKYCWEYEGIAYLFRQAEIPLYGVDLGTNKTNHPFMGLLVPSSRDENYGVNIFVPNIRKNEAQKLIANRGKLRKCAELEAKVGALYYEEFAKLALDSKARNTAARKQKLQGKRMDAVTRIRQFITDI